MCILYELGIIVTALWIKQPKPEADDAQPAG
jgi:hypothetical protein